MGGFCALVEIADAGDQARGKAMTKKFYPEKGSSGSARSLFDILIRHLSGRMQNAAKGNSSSRRFSQRLQYTRGDAMASAGLLTLVLVCFLLPVSGCSGGGFGVVKPSVSIEQGSTPTVVTGQALTLNAVTTGTGPFTFQWYLDGVAISGANASSYTLTATSDMNGKTISVVVTNPAGSTTQSSTLVVNTPPAVTKQPASQSVFIGDKATFTVAASGTAPFTYQWYLDGKAISGATESTYTTPITNLVGSYLYSVSVGNVAGSITSANAKLLVEPITDQLAFNAVSNHTYGDAPFAVNATSSSSGAITYSVVSGPATISGNVVTITGAGTVVLSATQAATSIYTAGSAQTSFTVGAESDSLSFNSIA